jgi:hypothetical protein
MPNFKNSKIKKPLYIGVLKFVFFNDPVFLDLFGSGLDRNILFSEPGYCPRTFVDIY